MIVVAKGGTAENTRHAVFFFFFREIRAVGDCSSSGAIFFSSLRTELN